jgi:hypothetical protein
MQLSPTLRTVLTFLAATLGALIPVGATIGIPLVALVVMGAFVAGLAAIGIIPPQTGGTQVGVVSPAIGVPPAIDTEPVTAERDAAAPLDFADVEEEPDPPIELAARDVVRQHSLADGPAINPDRQPLGDGTASTRLVGPYGDRAERDPAAQGDVAP